MGAAGGGRGVGVSLRGQTKHAREAMTLACHKTRQLTFLSRAAVGAVFANWRLTPHPHIGNAPCAWVADTTGSILELTLAPHELAAVRG